MRGGLRGIGSALVFVAGLLALWAIAARLAASPLAPGPAAVAEALATSLREGTLARAIGISVARLLVGYSVALALGVPLGVGLARNRILKDSVGPLVLGRSAVPSIVWLPAASL